ncbi:MAG: Na(+)/H(+) antiporter subunit B [Propionivibrio sp.]|nr:Na(+)/H(+) antiporter subunit B [Propionivibrio sp.]
MSPRALIAEVFLRLLYPLLLIASLWVLLRGHNAPGGGFVGGLLAVAASAAWGLTFSAEAALRRLPMLPAPLATLGVLLAALSGLPAVFAGQPFLTHLWFTLPLAITDVQLSTVMLFDLGVYLAVWGTLGGYCLALLANAEAAP